MSYATLVPSPFGRPRGLGAAASTSAKTTKIGFAIPPKKTYCGDIAVTADANGVKMNACGREITSAQGAADATIGVGQKIAQGAAVYGASAACGVALTPAASYFCGAAAGFLADKVLAPLGAKISEQVHIGICATDPNCDCEKDVTARAFADGRKIFDAHKPFCADTACVGWLYNTYQTGLPVRHRTYKIAGISANRCAYRALPHTSAGPIYAAPKVSDNKFVAALQSIKRTVTPPPVIGYAQPEVILPSVALFDRSKQRADKYIATMAKNAADTWLPRCETNKCREQISQASVVLGAKYAGSMLKNGVLLPDSPRYPMENKQGAVAEDFTKASAWFTDIAMGALAEESKTAGQEALNAYLSGKAVQAKNRGTESFRAWRNVQLRNARLADESRRKNMMLAGGLAVAFLAASAWVVIKRKGHNS